MLKSYEITARIPTKKTRRRRHIHERAERERPNIIDKVRQHEGGRRRASTEDSVLPPAPTGAESGRS